ncbi:MAG TPA: hypothetical protein VMW42_13650 [Desulfatiglandales bacterium]|nr:hypothetical protein [Desulfatiglandales bacterium]
MTKNLALHALPILQVLADEMFYHGKTRVFPSQKRIVNELKEKASIKRSIRSLNRWLAFAEKHGLIRRNKRHRFTAQNGWEWRSSLYEITMLGWNLLFRFGSWSREKYNLLVQRAKATFRKSKKPRRVFRPSGELTSIGSILEDHRYNTS